MEVKSKRPMPNQRVGGSSAGAQISHAAVEAPKPMQEYHCTLISHAAVHRGSKAIGEFAAIDTTDTLYTLPPALQDPPVQLIRVCDCKDHRHEILYQNRDKLIF